MTPENTTVHFVSSALPLTAATHVPEITENLKPEMSNQVTSNLIVLQATSELFQRSVSRMLCCEYVLNEAVTEVGKVTAKSQASIFARNE